MRTKCRRKCPKCDRFFTADRYNKHHQKYCTYPDCVLERARERKRKWYSECCREDPAFREKEHRRCQQGMARIRAQKKQAKMVSVPILPEPAVRHVLTGLIAQLSNCSDPQLLREQFNRYADQGQQLSVLLSFFFQFANRFFSLLLDIRSRRKNWLLDIRLNNKQFI